jgi:N-acetylglucosaminyldiphosphoundecaprenol N-acetyl-beta-D-mannosaminyltransferase
MVFFAVFCFAAALSLLSSRLPVSRERRSGGLRTEGVAFLVATLLPALCGLMLVNHVRMTDSSRMPGLVTIGLTVLLFLFTAWRGARRLPPWVADALVLCAAAVAIFAFNQPLVEAMTVPITREYVGLGTWSIVFTLAWVWLITRMTAALNRMPHVTGGYLGIVALSLLLFYNLSLPGTSPASVFPLAACAALAGAGLASVPAALRRENFNLGWACALAMGFLLAQITVIGLSKNLAFAVLALLLLVFGLPVLDVTFYRLRAARRGEKVAWEQSHMRLHEALQRRGISPIKVMMLYLAIAWFLCGLGVLFVVLSPLHPFVRIAVVAMLAFFGFVVFFSLARVLMRRAEGEEIPGDVEAFGVRISPVSMNEAMDKIDSFIQTRAPHHVVTSDANAILRAQEDSEYADIIRRAALITPDGYGVMWGARLLNLPIYERVTGVDMVTGICERAAQKGYSIYILGSSPGVASTAAQKLAQRYSGLRIAGTQHGYFKPEDEDAIVRQIHDAKPDVLFVAFGIPKQEKFIAKHFHALNVPVSLGVGGSFDVYSEKLKRAPIYIQRAGLEWLYRVWQEPWRWKRMSYVPRFMMLALREWLLGPSSAERARRARHNSST